MNLRKLFNSYAKRCSWEHGLARSTGEGSVKLARSYFDGINELHLNPDGTVVFLGWTLLTNRWTVTKRSRGLEAFYDFDDELKLGILDEMNLEILLNV